MFPQLSEAKIKGVIFVGSQIRKMLGSKELEDTMTSDERNAWGALRGIVHEFLGNNKSENYKDIVENLIEQYRTQGCRISLKLHYLHSHLDFFKENLGDVSDEHGERFHQDIRMMEKRYQEKWDSAMMGDYIWFLIREDDNAVHKKKSRSNVHF